MSDTTNQTDSNNQQVEVDDRIKKFCVEMSASFLRTEAERDFRKAAIDNLHEITGVEKKVLNFCARTYHRQDFDDKSKSVGEQMSFYVRIFGEPKGNDNQQDEDDFDDN